jgi:hypothetical protein
MEGDRVSFVLPSTVAPRQQSAALNTTTQLDTRTVKMGKRKRSRHIKRLLTICDFLCRTCPQYGIFFGNFRRDCLQSHGTILFSLLFSLRFSFLFQSVSSPTHFVNVKQTENRATVQLRTAPSVSGNPLAEKYEKERKENCEIRR